MTTAIQETKSEKPMEFVPFGAADKIKLSISIIQNIVAVPTKSGKTCSERDALKFMMLCQAQRLNPFAGDAFLIGYDSQTGPSFSLITAHQAFLKRAESSKDFDGMTSGILLRLDDDTVVEREGDFHLRSESDSVVGGWARVFHKQRTHPIYRRVRMERFNKGFAQWKEDPAGMICKCAEADALRSAFPTLLGGLYAPEEMTQAIEVESTPSFVAALAPAKAPQVSDRKTSNPCSDLEAVVVEAGFDFNALQKWGIETGNIENADALASFDEIPSDTAKRLLRAKAGLITGLQAGKAVAA